jgi:Calponin homology (CH) domain/Leucine Rich repeat
LTTVVFVFSCCIAVFLSPPLNLSILSLDVNDIIQNRQKATLNVLWNILRHHTLKGLHGLTGIVLGSMLSQRTIPGLDGDSSLHNLSEMSGTSVHRSASVSSRHAAGSAADAVCVDSDSDTDSTSDTDSDSDLPHSSSSSSSPSSHNTRQKRAQSHNSASSSRRPVQTTVRATLLKWINRTFAGSGHTHTHAISDFWNSFTDGVAFCGIVNQLVPGSIDMSQVSSEDAKQNLETAFNIAEEHLGIPSLLSAQDFAPDAKSNERTVENYLCLLVSAAQAKAKHESFLSRTTANHSNTVHQPTTTPSCADADANTNTNTNTDTDSVSAVDTQSSVGSDIDSIAALKEQITSEQKQHELLKADIEQLRQMHSESYAHENELQEQLQSVSAERELFNGKIDELQHALDEAHKKLVSAMDREKQLNSTVAELHGDVNDLKKQVAVRDERVNEMRAEMYDMYREKNNILSNARSGIRRESQMLRSHKRSMTAQSIHDLTAESVRETKSTDDFLNAMPPHTGMIMKRRPGSGGMKLFGGKSWKQRYLALDGSRLTWHKKSDSPPKGYADLKHYKQISLERVVQVDDVHNRRSSMNLDEHKSTEPLILRLEPKQSAKGIAKVLELCAPADKTLSEGNDELFTWLVEINTRIALIDYMTGGQQRTGSERMCREVVDFIVDRDAKELCIVQKVAGIHFALEAFKEPLILRKGIHIVLDNVALEDKTVDVIADILMRNNTVDLLDLSSNSVTYKGATVLSNALLVNRSLRVLRLDNNNLDDEAFAILADGLSGHKHLQELSLCDNDATHLGAEYLVKALSASQARFRQAHVFPKIMLNQNRIGDQGVRAISELLQVNSTIKELHLAENGITDQAVRYLVTALEHKSCSVHLIDLCNNEISSEGVVSLADLLKRTHRNISIDLSENVLIGQKGVQALLDTQLPIKYSKLMLTCTPNEQ